MNRSASSGYSSDQLRTTTPGGRHEKRQHEIVGRTNRGSCPDCCCILSGAVVGSGVGRCARGECRGIDGRNDDESCLNRRGDHHESGLNGRNHYDESCLNGRDDNESSFHRDHDRRLHDEQSSRGGNFHARANSAAAHSADAARHVARGCDEHRTGPPGPQRLASDQPQAELEIRRYIDDQR